MDAARAALTGGKSLGTLASEREAARQANAVKPAAPAAAPAAPVPPKGTHPSQTQPRKADGTFEPQVGSQKPGEAPPAVPADPAAPPADPAAPPADPAIDPATGAPSGDEGAETFDQLTDEEKKLVIELPGRREGEESELVAMPDEATAERLRQVLNGYQRVEQLRAEREAFTAQREEFQATQTEMQIDPLGYILDSNRSGITPKQQVNLALSILTSEEVWDRAKGVLDQIIKNPQALATLRAEAKAERGELREEARTTVQEQQILSRNARGIMSVIDRITPDGFADQQRELFVRDCLSDVKQFLRDRNLRTLDPRYVPQILQQRLGLYGINPEMVKAALSSARPAAPARANGAPPAGTPPRAPAPPKQPTAADLRKGSERRAAAAAAAPPGVGAPGTGVQAPPKGSSLKEAFKHARAVISGRPG